MQRYMQAIERRVISFSLFGNDSRYTSGALRNLALAAIHFPGSLYIIYNASGKSVLPYNFSFFNSPRQDGGYTSTLTTASLQTY